MLYKSIKHIEKTASNGRFGASGAVARLKVCADLQVLRPSERQWKPRLPQAAGTLPASGTAQCDWEAKKTERCRQRYRNLKVMNE